jgi:hypothetical protein
MAEKKKILFIKYLKNKIMEFHSLYKILVDEMSEPWDSYVNPITTVQNKWQEYKHDSKQIVPFKTMYGTEIDVFLYDKEKLKRLFFITNDVPRGNVDFYLLKDGGIQIYETIKGVPYEFHMSDVFKNYLLLNFSYILSSTFHTKEGFHLYKRLAKDSDIKLTVVDTDKGTEIILNSPDELDNYYGTGKRNFVYKISKK